MPTVASCLRQHAPAVLQAFGERLPLPWRVVLDAVTRCRTGALGHMLIKCETCQAKHLIGRSCGNRHCPNCQKHKTQSWLAKQSERLLPVHHFLVTFTVPEELRSLLRAHRREGYTAIFDCGSATIRDVAGAMRSLAGCQLGFFGVLHTWGRDPMVFHPHVHFVVPGGGVNESEGCWQATAENFFIHHAAACRVYKEKFKARLAELDLLDQVDPKAWRKKWNVDIKPVGNGQAVLKYLAPYVYRVAISDSRIVSCTDQGVTYRYTPSGTRSSKQRTVSGLEFALGFLQHVLPRGFQKVRYYGWMSPNSRIRTEEVRWLVWLFLGWTFTLAMLARKEEPSSPLNRCADCGGPLTVVKITDQHQRVIYSRGPPTGKAS